MHNFKLHRGTQIETCWNMYCARGQRKWIKWKQNGEVVFQAMQCLQNSEYEPLKYTPKWASLVAQW